MVFIKISLADIFKYIGDRSRPMVEGEQLFKAGHVILCQIKNVEELEIFGLVLQTSGLTSKPHEVTLHLKNPVNNWTCICTCKAGQSGFCKHVIAVLIYVNRHEELEEFSCTAYTQAWGKEKEAIKEKYEAEPAVSFYQHDKTKVEDNIVFSYKTNPRVDEKNFECFVNCNKSSALHIFLQRSRNSSIRNDSITKKQRKLDIDHNSVVKIMLENATHSVLESMELPEFLQHDCCRTLIENLKRDDILEAAKVEQSMTEWLNLRRLRVTGSRIYSIFTYAKEDWSEKAINYFWPKSFSSKFTEYGKKYEQHALTAYKRQHPSYSIHNVGIVISKKYPWFGYSPDGIIFENGKPITLLEIKCPYSDAFKKTAEHFKHIDILINNAGIMDDGIWEREIDINLKGVVNGMILGIENYLKTHRQDDEALIVNISSVAGVKGYGYMPIYCATKFAVNGLSLAWATHYDYSKVKVISFCPGATLTPLLDVTPEKLIAPIYFTVDKDVNELLEGRQEMDVVAENMVNVIKQAENGTIWVSEYSKPAYEIEFPKRRMLNDY